MKIAIVGKRNAGKSTLINTLAQEERVIVSEIPGTTRDSVDVKFEIGIIRDLYKRSGYFSAKKKFKEELDLIN